MSLRSLYWLLLFSVSFHQSTVVAANYYLQATGINENDQSQNYDSFYDLSIQFNEFCIKTKSTCENYINTDSKLLPPALKLSKKINSNGKPTRSLILKRISELIKNAKDQDQIIISLNNHGGPGVGKEGTSCIFLTSKEKVCDDDIRPLLKNLKSGVKVAIIADGCFSGGFAKLANSQVCVAATADQNLVGFAAVKSGDGSIKNEFWEMLTNKKIKKFSDISVLRDEDESIRLRPGSDMMKINTCAEAVDRLTELLRTKFNLNLRVYLNDYLSGRMELCEAYPSKNYFGEFSKKIEATDKFSTQVILAEICKEQEFKELCEGWKSILKTNQSSRVLGAQVRYEASKDKLIKALDLKVNLPPDRLMEYHEQVSTKVQKYISGSGPNVFSGILSFSKMDKAIDKHAREIYAAYTDYKKSKDDLIKERVQAVQSKKIVNFVKDCFNKGYSESLQNSAISYSYSYKVQKRLHFTNKNYEEAKKCENTFQF